MKLVKKLFTYLLRLVIVLLILGTLKFLWGLVWKTVKTILRVLFK